MDERDLVRYGLLFTEDGEWCAVSGRAVGPKHISDFLEQYCEPWESEDQRSYHSMSDLVIDVDGNIATARGQWRHDFPSEEGRPVTVHFGRFEALLQRTQHGWRIKRRASYGLLPFIEPSFQLTGPEEAIRNRDIQPANVSPKPEIGLGAVPDADKTELLKKRIKALDRRVREAEDRDALYRLFVNVQSAMDERDMVQYGLFYTADGEWCAVNGRAVGPSQITEHLKQYCKPWDSAAHRTYHSISDVTIELDGDRALGHAQWQHSHPDENGHPVVKAFGHFEAVAVRTSDGWRLRRRASYLKIPYIEPEYQLIGLPALENETLLRAESKALGSPPLKDKRNSGPNMLQQLSDHLDVLEQRSRLIEDRAAIYRQFIELQDATDTRDGVRYGQCFTNDGEWSGVTGKAVGQAEIIEYMSNFMTPWESEESRTFHSISDLAIDLQGDWATARAQYRHYKLDEGGRPIAFHFCHYEATLQRTQAGWRFKRRDSYMDIPYKEPKFQLTEVSNA